MVFEWGFVASVDKSLLTSVTILVFCRYESPVSHLFVQNPIQLLALIMRPKHRVWIHFLAVLHKTCKLFLLTGEITTVWHHSGYLTAACSLIVTGTYMVDGGFVFLPRFIQFEDHFCWGSTTEAPELIPEQLPSMIKDPWLHDQLYYFLEITDNLCWVF